MRSRATSSAAIVVVAVAAALAVNAGAAAPAVLRCAPATVQAGVLSPVGHGGASCLLRAFRQHCRPAADELSTFGVDTIARDTFRLADVKGRCRVEVATSFTVVPQKPRPGGTGRCTGLAVRGADIVATGCVGGGLNRSVSLIAGRSG
jgi:hypothetical protein